MASSSKLQKSTSARAAREAGAARSSGRLGSWDLVRLAGEGQLASVYQARPAGGPVDQPASYAVKVLRGQWQDDSHGLAILAREAQVGRTVVHPHLIPILAAHLTEPPYFLVMPFLAGRSLAEHLPAQVSLELPLAFWFARQVAEALEALHRAGWMHCDVKPSNIFISPAGHVTLIDLGFARHVRESRSAADRPVLGTISYIAPEMLYSALGGDFKSDVYSLGVTLFEMLTGRLPFDGEDIAELALQHRQELPGDLRSLVPHLPTRAARLVNQMLAKEPLRRPPPHDVIERLTALEIETFAERFDNKI
ncbi:MAG: serine/threonine protein kinase [Planctomycetia bacterium]|nr:serine/threonine protein kinase [Planctomycetia bacterium]